MTPVPGFGLHVQMLRTRIGVTFGPGRRYTSLLQPFASIWLVGLLALPVMALGQSTCRPNIFGGQDCEAPEGRSSSRPNIFGGFDTEGPGKARSSSQPNIFGGEDIRTGGGTIQSQPNIFGGETYRLPNRGARRGGTERLWRAGLQISGRADCEMLTQHLRR